MHFINSAAKNILNDMNELKSKKKEFKKEAG